MTFVLYTSGGNSRGCVRACPPERGFEYVADPSQALKFSSEAEALAYLTAEHDVRALHTNRVIGKITPHYALNVGDL